MKHIGRKIYHLAGGLLLLSVYLMLGRTAGLSALSGLLVVVTVADLARLKLPRVNEFVYAHLGRFVRESERSTLTGTPWYFLGLTLALALYGVPAGAYAVIFLACGDVAATTIGERWGSIKIAGAKSLQGTAAFVVASLAGGAVMDVFFFPMPVAVFAAGAVIAAAVELLPPWVNDNLAIPVVSGAVMQALIFFLH